VGNGRSPKYVLKLASGVWLGLESGHSNQRKTAPERVAMIGKILKNLQQISKNKLLKTF